MKFETILAERKNKVIYKDGDKTIKVFDESFPKSDILNEALNQARVEETGLNIPSLQEVTKIDGKWAIISDYIEGKTLAQLMEENPEKTDEYLELFVNLQMEVLSKKAPLLNKLKDKMQRKISETGLDATTRYELSTRLHGMPKHTKVCHGDFNPSNIIITADGTPYILDWSHATHTTGFGTVRFRASIPTGPRRISAANWTSGPPKSSVPWARAHLRTGRWSAPAAAAWFTTGPSPATTSTRVFCGNTAPCPSTRPCAGPTGWRASSTICSTTKTYRL